MGFGLATHKRIIERSTIGLAVLIVRFLHMRAGQQHEVNMPAEIDMRVHRYFGVLFVLVLDQPQNSPLRQHPTRASGTAAPGPARAKRSSITGTRRPVRVRSNSSMNVAETSNCFHSQVWAKPSPSVGAVNRKGKTSALGRGPGQSPCRVCETCRVGPVALRRAGPP